MSLSRFVQNHMVSLFHRVKQDNVGTGDHADKDQQIEHQASNLLHVQD
jgi:hypothetical protein